jgi:uncharacterized protein (DUF1501 family)
VREAERLRTVLAPTADRAIAALLGDLADRGLLGETLVAVLSEFGRTPRLNGAGGRDHWGHVFSAALAGGGVKGGQAYGSSDKQGGYPREGKVTPTDLTATLLHGLGLDPQAEVRDTQDRPFPASRGEVVRGIL